MISRRLPNYSSEAREICRVGLARLVRITLFAIALTMGLRAGHAMAVQFPIPFQSFRLTGTGTCTYQPPSYPCTAYKASGSASVVGAVKVKWSTRVKPEDGFDNGQGGICYPTTGDGQLSGRYKGYNFSNGFTFAGLLCEVGAPGASVPQTFNGTYFTNGYAIGGGSLVWSNNGAGKILISVKGSIRR